MMSARACGMDTAARTAAAEIPTTMLEVRIIEFMEIPPLQERDTRLGGYQKGTSRKASQASPALMYKA